MPSVLLTNVNRLSNKLDELYILLADSSVDIVCITETWLTAETPDSFCNLFGYLFYRNDRIERMGGGVGCYVKTGIFSRLIDPPVLKKLNFEVLWLALRPSVLPRPLSVVIVLVVYVPPWYDVASKKSLIDYLVNCVDYLNSVYANALFLMTGDFNSLETSFFSRLLHFKQIITGKTRGKNTLDKIFTNFPKLYGESEILPPLGRSDHNCVLLKAADQCLAPIGHRVINKRIIFLNRFMIILAQS